MNINIISGSLETLSGLHTDSGALSEVTDAPFYRNANGEIIIPGTSLAGSLRSLATRIAPHLGAPRCIAIEKKPSTRFCVCPVCALFGSITSSKQSEDGIASRLWFHDAVLESGGNTSVRDGVGIDRRTGAAAWEARAKYDYEVIHKGALFSFRLIFHGELNSQEENILACVLDEWQRGRGYIGGGKGRGLGNIKLRDARLYTVNLSDKDSLMTYLRRDDPLDAADEKGDRLGLKSKPLPARGRDCDAYLYNSFCQIDFNLEFSGGFLINNTLKAVRTGFAFFPRTEGDAFMIPGSSLRGVIRSQAEKIARTIITQECEGGKEFMARCPACNPFAGRENPLTSCGDLFHNYKQQKKDAEIKVRQLCLTCRLFGSLDWGSRLYFHDAYLSGEPRIKIMDFLAIDRFTGGGKEGAKFDAVVLWRPKFKVRIFLENVQNWHLGWLLLVFRDLEEGLISFGFGRNKWFGRAKIGTLHMKLGAVSKDDLPGKLKEGQDSREGLFHTETLTLNALTAISGEPVLDWVADFQKKLLAFRREEEFIPHTDTYFTGDLFTLYPRGWQYDKSR